MRVRVAALLPFALAAAACVQTNAVELSPNQKFPPVPADQVQLFLSEADVKGEYVKVALINAEADSELTDEAKMIRAMQKKAGALGANAIILGEIKEPGAGAKVAGAIFGVPTERKGRVVAIRLADPRPQPEALQPESLEDAARQPEPES